MEQTRERPGAFTLPNAVCILLLIIALSCLPKVVSGVNTELMSV